MTVYVKIGFFLCHPHQSVLTTFTMESMGSVTNVCECVLGSTQPPSCDLHLGLRLETAWSSLRAAGWLAAYSAGILLAKRPSTRLDFFHHLTEKCK